MSSLSTASRHPSRLQLRQVKLLIPLCEISPLSLADEPL